jgi:hypothetical protein
LSGSRATVHWLPLSGMESRECEAELIGEAYIAYVIAATGGIQQLFHGRRFGRNE